MKLRQGGLFMNIYKCFLTLLEATELYLECNFVGESLNIMCEKCICIYIYNLKREKQLNTVTCRGILLASLIFLSEWHIVAIIK